MEGLRGAAVTLVFLQHYTVQTLLIGLPPGPASAAAVAFRNYGNWGVELFFVLSGYLIYGTLVRGRPRFLSFMARRLQRIYPAFLVVFALALALTAVVPGSGKIPAGTWQAAVFLAANIALLPGLIPMDRVVDVAWSLSYEMFFYLATGALVLGTGLSANPARRIAIIGVLAAGFLVASLARIPYFPVRMMPFFAGMLLAEGLGARVPAWLGWAAPALGFVIAVSHAAPGALGEVIQTIAFFALCAVCFRGAGVVSTWMAWAPLRWIGNMSYSYYLLHGFVVRAAMLVVARALPGGMSETVFWAFMPVLYAATLAASALLFVMVEKSLSLRSVIGNGRTAMPALATPVGRPGLRAVRSRAGRWWS